MTTVSNCAQFRSPSKIGYTDTSLTGDGHALEENRRDRAALSPSDVGLNVKTTPYEVSGGLFLQTTLKVERKDPANNILLLRIHAWPARPEQ